jgi:hypothetical protein
MSREEPELTLLNQLFEEAVRQHGDDPKKVANDVKARISALGLADQMSVDGAIERLLAFRAPPFPRRPLN